MKTSSKFVTLAIVLIHGFVWSQTDALTILPNGNVGVGTTTPAQKLEVNGNIQSATSFTGLGFYGKEYATFNYKGLENVKGKYALLQKNTGETFLNASLGQSIRFRIDNVDKIIVHSNGNFGIGITAPKIILDVKENSIIGSSAQSVNQHHISNRGTKVSFGHNGSEFVGMRTIISPGTNACGNSGDIRFDTWECNTSTSREVMRINGTGNVGIGTDKPNSTLHIRTKGSDAFTVGSSALRIDSNNAENGSLQIGVSKGYSWIQSHGAKPLVINRGNNVGIGTATPTQAKLVVSGSVNHTPKFVRKIPPFNAVSEYKDGILNKTTLSNSAIPYSIYASNHIAAQQFSTFSDARVKTIFGVSNVEKDLETLSKIEITDYTMIDTIGKGNQVYKKVIAQQVKEVYPQAVSSDLTDVIPNIYALSTIKEGWIKTNTKELVIGDKVKLIFSEEEVVVDVLDIQGDAIKVASDQEGQVFVYGKQVADFHTVDYEAIAMLNVSATQALLKRIELLEAEKKKLTGDFENYKTSVNDRLSKIEQALQNETVMN